jgi:hypothetical protein
MSQLENQLFREIVAHCQRYSLWLRGYEQAGAWCFNTDVITYTFGGESFDEKDIWLTASGRPEGRPEY